MGHYDSHKVSEELVRGVLREIFGWHNLRNLNFSEGKNFPAADLADDEVGVAVQVTATPTLEKVKETVQLFLKHGLDARYPRLVIYVLVGKEKRYSQSIIDKVSQGRINFSAERDILDYSDLCAAALYCDPDKLRSAVEVLRSYMDTRSGELSHAPMAMPRAELFERHQVAIHDRLIHVRDEAVSLEIVVPSPCSASMSAVLSLAREDLKGVVLQIGAQELVEWIEWRQHAPAEAERPYAPPMRDEPGRYLFTSRAARVRLQEREVQNLDWVLRTAAAPVLERARSLCNSWQVHRFKRIQADIGQDVFAIVRVHRDLWDLMIEFARNHDASKGDSEWHVFDFAPGCLKVYTSRESEQLAAGYHLLCYPFNDGLYRDIGDEDVVVGWTAPFEVDRSKTISPKEQWDAEVAHEWLLRRFIPKVIESELAGRLQQWRRRRWLLQTFRESAPRRIHGDAVASSAAVAAMPSASLPAADARSLEESISTLQRFFNVPRGTVVAAAHFRAVLQVASRWAPLSDPLDEYYIRSKLDLDDDGTVVEGLERRIGEEREAVSWFEMDVAFRALLAIVENTKHAEPGHLMYAAQQLQPLWNMHQDHQLLRHWRS